MDEFPFLISLLEGLLATGKDDGYSEVYDGLKDATFLCLKCLLGQFREITDSLQQNSKELLQFLQA